MTGHDRFTLTWARAALPLLLILNLAVRLAIICRPLPIIDDLAIPDDTYLSLTIARNIAHGLGPRFGTIYTNGFQPLYVFLVAPAFWIWPTDPAPPLRAALVLLTLFDTAALMILYRWIVDRTGSPATAFVTGLAWAFNPYVITMTLGGLETAVSLCFVVASLRTLDSAISDVGTGRVREVDGGRWTRLGILLGLAIFARIDGVILAAVALMGVVVALLRAGWSAGRIVRASAWVGGAALAVNVPWLAYLWHHTGGLFPVSGRAVRFMSLAWVNHQPTFQNWYWPVLKAAARVLWTSCWPVLLAIALFGLAGILLRVMGRLRVGGGLPPSAPPTPRIVMHGVLITYALALFSAYTFYIFSAGFFPRYFLPFLIPLLVSLSVTVHAALRPFACSARADAAATVLSALAVTAGFVTLPQFGELFTSTESTTNGYMNLGLWARARFPPGTIVGGSQTGALAYFAPELVVVNLDGVVSKPCLDAMQEFRNMSCVRAAGVQYIVNWQMNTDFLIRHSRGMRQDELVLVEPIPGFTSWRQRWFLWEVRR